MGLITEIDGPEVSCRACGAPFAPPGPCAVCRWQVGAPYEDSLVGRVIGGRFEILDLLAAGGMGRVYRALQRSIDREVAIKVIHAHLVGDAEVVERFLIEAQAASRLDHPNVVAIHEFGQLSPAEGGRLFLAMELLRGESLRALLERGELLAPERAARVVLSLLAALGEAHAWGVVHRDVKPDNVMLDARPEGDVVKVIDFGIAALTTRADGSVAGTPQYMSPEQARGVGVGPATDLHAAGVLLHELLTGAPAFEGEDAVDVLAKVLGAERVHPSDALPERGIPRALGDVCVRAAAIDPADRFPDAATMAAAIEEAVTGRTPRPAPARPAPTEPRDDGHSIFSILPPALAAIPPARGPVFDRGFVGREIDLAWCFAWLSDDGPVAAALWGREGIGRTRLLREVAARATRRGVHVVSVAPDPWPLGENGHVGLRRVVAVLLGRAPGDVPPQELVAAAPAEPRRGLRLLFSSSLDEANLEPEEIASARLAALRWALDRAIERADGRMVLLCLDDADRLDGASLLALTQLVSSPLPARVLMTSVQAPDASLAKVVCARWLGGLTKADSERLLGCALPFQVDEVEPLVVELVARASAHEASSPSLHAMVDRALRALDSPSRRVLRAIAVLGRVPAMRLAAVLDAPDEVDDALASLEDAGLVQKAGGQWVVHHAIYARVLLEITPAGALERLHQRAARLATGPRDLELHTFHALRGPARAAAYALADDAAALRTLRGDRAGAMAILRAAADAARRQAERGDPEANEIRRAVGHALAAALLDVSQVDDALRVLNETFTLSRASDLRHALLLEQLSAALRRCDQGVEAERHRRDALAIAERHGAPELVERLSTPRWRTSSTLPPTVFRPA